MAHVRDIMEKNVITIPLDKTALDAAKLLKEKEISFLVIVQDDKPLGLVTERDIVRRIAAEDKSASSTKLENIMSAHFKWVEPSTTVDSAVQKMVNNNIRRLVVLENEKLVGVITQTDLAEFLRSKLLINETVENLDKN